MICSSISHLPKLGRVARLFVRGGRGVALLLTVLAGPASQAAGVDPSAVEALTYPGAPVTPSEVNIDLRHLPKPLSSQIDRKSTRLNSSHANISYAVFC